MKKKLLILILLSSTLLFGSENVPEVKKVDNLLSSQQDIKSRLNFLKKKELYVQELEKKFNKTTSTNNLEKKYNLLEKKYLKKNLDTLENKKEFLEFEKNLSKELFERIENIEKQI